MLPAGVVSVVVALKSTDPKWHQFIVAEMKDALTRFGEIMIDPSAAGYPDQHARKAPGTRPPTRSPVTLRPAALSACRWAVVHAVQGSRPSRSCAGS
jgi:hypothetical protein